MNSLVSRKHLLCVVTERFLSIAWQPKMMTTITYEALTTANKLNKERSTKTFFLFSLKAKLKTYKYQGLTWQW